MSILVTRSSMPSIEEYIEEIRPIFESHHLTNMGPIYKKLQHQLIEYLGIPELSLFVNGHIALEMAIDALGLKEKGGEVITTPFTFVSTTHAIVRNGLKPVFCDIKQSDYTMDPEKIEELITDKTVAIIPVHVYGNLCDVEAIQRIADKHNLKVIYDAAHAFGVKYKGVGVGNFGDASMFSFHATKVFNTIEGGAVASVHFIKGIKNQSIIYHHIKKVWINATAMFSWKIWINTTESWVFHHRLYYHFTENPFQRRTLIFVIAITKQIIPHIKPHKMYDFMDA